MDFYHDTKKSEKIYWFKDPSDIRQGLSSLKPGVSIWSSKRIGEPIKPYLKAWMTEALTTDGDSEDKENLKKHCAIALALLGDRTGLPILREMIRERDSVVLQDCRKNNQIRGCMAIYLAGKLRDAESETLLLDLICQDEQIPSTWRNKAQETIGCGVAIEQLHPNDQGYDKLYFQFFSHSIMALLKIAESASGGKRIRAILEKRLKDKTYIQRITHKAPGTHEYVMAENLWYRLDTNSQNQKVGWINIFKK